MNLYRFDICEYGGNGINGLVVMNGQRLAGVACVTVVSRAGEAPRVTVEFIAESINHAAKEALLALPRWEPIP